VARSRLSLEAFYKIAGLLAISRRMMRLQKSSYMYDIRLKKLPQSVVDVMENLGKGLDLSVWHPLL
jgi:hypothetical protein